MKFGIKALSKVVLKGSNGTRRVVYYNPRTNRQVAVVTSHLLYVASLDYEYWGGPPEWSNYTVSIPVEGKNGRSVECKNLGPAEAIANRECSTMGRVLNVLFYLPVVTHLRDYFTKAWRSF